jgi:hypothetical protein
MENDPLEGAKAADREDHQGPLHIPTQPRGGLAFDGLRTVMQRAVAAGMHVHAYLESILRVDPEEISAHPQ